jgi:FSR family fosmidomycin resistance protein-like MFS transporter
MATATTLDAVEAAEERNKGRNTLATVVVAGHAVKHLYLSALQSILMPEIKIAFGLNGAEVGTLATVRQFSGWATTIGSGFLGDRFATKTGLMLAISLSMMGVAFFLVGMSETYLMLFAALLLAGIGPSMYHPPAIGALSRRFPDKRAFAISLHGSGGSVGEVLGPVTAAGLLTLLTWEGILQVSMLPAVFCAYLVWKVMGGLEFADGGGSTLRAYFASLGVMLKNRALALLVLITALRSMGQSSISLFLPVYLREDLDYSSATVGIFLSMAQLVGIGSQPLMGYLSDRVGHKKVLIPAMLCLGGLFAALAFAEGDLQLAVTILLLGAFLYSLHSIFISAAIGVVGENGQSTVVSVMYGASFLGILSPIIAGVIVDETRTQNAFIYGSVMVFLATFVLAVMRLPRGEAVAHAH